MQEETICVKCWWTDRRTDRRTDVSRDRSDEPRWAKNALPHRTSQLPTFDEQLAPNWQNGWKCSLLQQACNQQLLYYVPLGVHPESPASGILQILFHKYGMYSSTHTHVINHNWSATKQRLHPQSVAEISRHSVLSGDRIRQCETSSGSRHKDTDQCL